jgi:heme A synthase
VSRTATDQATADAFLRKQVVLTALTGAVALAVLAGVALIVSWTSERSKHIAVAAIVVALVVLTVALGTLVLHAVRLASFAFRKEVH